MKFEIGAIYRYHYRLLTNEQFSHVGKYWDRTNQEVSHFCTFYSKNNCWLKSYKIFLFIALIKKYSYTARPTKHKYAGTCQYQTKIPQQLTHLTGGRKCCPCMYKRKPMKINIGCLRALPLS